MKKFFIILIFSLPLFSKSQDRKVLDSTAEANLKKLKQQKEKDSISTTFYVQIQYQRTFKKYLQNYEGDYPWLWVSYGRKAGIFLFLSREGGEATGISFGPYFSFGTKVYSEIGIGIGTEFPDHADIDHQVVPYGWGYYYFENKPDARLAKHKVIVQGQYAYSKEWGSWTMGSVTWTPWQKFFGIGLWGQTETNWGGKVVANLPIGRSVIVSTWLGGGAHKKITWGTDITLQVTHTRRKN